MFTTPQIILLLSEVKGGGWDSKYHLIYYINQNLQLDQGKTNTFSFLCSEIRLSLQRSVFGLREKTVNIHLSLSTPFLSCHGRSTATTFMPREFHRQVNIELKHNQFPRVCLNV